LGLRDLSGRDLVAAAGHDAHGLGDGHLPLGHGPGEGDLVAVLDVDPVRGFAVLVDKAAGQGGVPRMPSSIERANHRPRQEYYLAITQRAGDR
jgi:hypothetical protein